MKTPELERHQDLERQLLFTLPCSPTPCSQQGRAQNQPGRKWEPRKGKGDWRGTARQESTGCRGWSTFPGSGAQRADSVCLQAVAEKGYETGEHAPGLKLGGCGAYKAAHHIIKVKNLLELCLKSWGN